MHTTRLSGGVLAAFLCAGLAAQGQASWGSRQRVLAAAGEDELLPGRQFPLPGDPRVLAVGDLDGDGLEDVVAAGADLLSVHPGAPGGVFETALVQAALPGSSPSALLVGDLDGDGLGDVVVADRGNDQVQVWLADPSGGLALAAMHPVPAGPVELALADADGDGAPDVMVVSDSQRSLTVLFGDGAGGLVSAASTPLSASPSALAVGDLNGDGKLDAAVAGRFTSDVTVLLGNGAGTFSAPLRLIVGARPADLRATDLNGDGVLDLLAVAQGGLWPLLGNGSGGFAGLPNVFAGTGRIQTLAVADLDGDGTVDAVTGQAPAVGLASGFWVSRGDGRGSFLAPERHAGSSELVELADVDRDGLADVLSLQPGPPAFFGVLRGRPGGRFRAPEERLGRLLEVTSVATFDADGDGLGDLVAVGATTDRLEVLLGDARGGFRSSTTYFTGSAPSDVDGFDFDADGDLDLITLNASSDDVTVLFGSGAGDFTVRVDWPLPGVGGTALRATDLDGDGLGDLLVVLTGSDSVGVLFTDGRGGVGRSQTVPTFAPRPHGLGLGDLDQDGDLDLVVGTLDTAGSLTVLENDGAGRLVPGLPSSSISSGGRPAALVLEDLDRDGDLDLAVAHWGTNLLGVHRGRGSLRLGREVSSSWLGAEPASLFSADLDADGTPELLAPNTGTANLCVLRSSGTLSFESRGYAAGVPRPNDLALLDVDLDGGVDVLVAGRSAAVTLLRSSVGTHVALTPFGEGTPGCSGRGGVTSSVAPEVGAGDFGLTFTNVPPATEGYLLIGLSPVPQGLDPFAWGVRLYVDPATRIHPVSPRGTSGDAGIAFVPLSIPDDPALADLELHAQLVLVEPAWRSCSPSPVRVVTTRAVTFTIR